MDELGLRTHSASVPEHESRGAVLVAGQQTGGRFAVVEVVEERDTGLPRHLHHWEDESLYVLGGYLDAWVAGEWIAVPAGTAVFLPRGVEHALVAAPEGARVLALLVPAGFERFYHQTCAAVTPNVERLVALAARYGCEITGPALAPPLKTSRNPARDGSPERARTVGREGRNRTRERPREEG